MSINRRQILQGAAAITGTALLSACGAASVRPRIAAYPFQLGVASGEPTPDGVVLWTRLAPQPLARDWGMPPLDVELSWELAQDEQFSQIVRQGRHIARPQSAHSVHVEVEGLLPNRVYWYRFLADGEVSPVGRTRTTPLPGSDVASLRYAFSACQRYEDGYYAAYRHMVADDPDLIIFLGDYIYEQAPRNGLPRRHSAGEARDLDSYRRRYGCYKRDPQLQLAHASAPWMSIWDDHETKNNYGPNYTPDGSSPAQFLKRRAAAYQAYYEHMPLRRRSMPSGMEMRLYRSLSWGRLAQFQFLDTRQYRDQPPCESESYSRKLIRDCAERHDPRRSLLGASQEQWLREGLASSTARWNIVAQQYVMVELKRRAGGGDWGYGNDGWDGYPANRNRLLEQLAQVSNPMVLCGDMHSFGASDLRASADSPVVAPAFLGGAISSPGQDYASMLELQQDNADFRFVDNRVRGYALANVSATSTDIAYRALDDVTDPDSPISDLVKFSLEAGNPEFRQA